MPEALEKTGGQVKPNLRRARLVNKRLSSADAILSRVIVKRDCGAKFNAMISDVSSGLIDDFILKESGKMQEDSQAFITLNAIQSASLWDLNASCVMPYLAPNMSLKSIGSLPGGSFISWQGEHLG